MSPCATPEGENMQQSHMRHQGQHQPGLHEQHRDRHQRHHQAQRAQQIQVEQQSPGKQQAQAGEQIKDGQQTQDNHTNPGPQPHNVHQQHQSSQQNHENLGSLSYTPQGDNPSFPMSPPAAAPPGLATAATHFEVVEKLNTCWKELEDQSRKMHEYLLSAASHYGKLEEELEEAKKRQRDAEKQVEESKIQHEEAWKAAAEQFQQQGTKLQLHQERGDRAESKAQHLEDCLQASSKELEAERAFRVQAEKQVAEKHKFWKQAASELRKKTMARPAPSQVTDEYLVNEMRKLRYTIRNFAVSYFEGPPRDIDPNQLKKTEWHDKIAAIFPEADWILQYIMSNEKCPSIAQALLWEVLQIWVFGSFRWAGKLGESLQALKSSLAPDPETSSTSDSVKKYYKWRAETANLVLASMTGIDGQPIPNEAFESWKLGCIEGMRYLINPFLRKSDHTDKSYVDDLSQILDQALALDREMSVQVSPVVLFKRDVKPPLHFKQDEMELEHGETLSTADQQVFLVVSPAMMRRGNSSGEDFDQERILLPMEISCSPGTQYRMTRATNPWDMLRYLKPLVYRSSTTSQPKGGNRKRRWVS
ncbi:hypothetical protein GGTG_13429 [Gaeumannomyces tritici R3-111a-1]|uniref:Uncharacterized protein n=1 Tax=Gaeumannomyces tritici (strain R3-111a-1) TaxID=644352 RepID=J3PIU9_GAET3|nr:hypothetical protein GGTG_13429 [Gaeumannomyces tritici R3-111a-1]EJT69032.1 hypothetical protein GGTG_13429 [Gaeumannomyces tritici R3-111a-1]